MVRKKRATSRRKESQEFSLKHPFRLSDIRLVDCASRQAISNEALPKHSSIRVNVDIGEYKGEEAVGIAARPSVVFAAWYDGKSQDDASLIVTATFQLLYEFPKGAKLPPKKTHTMFGSLSLLHAWPYIREFMQSHISRMGLPPILIPLLAMPDAAKAKNQQVGISRKKAVGRIRPRSGAKPK